jgi:metal-responsive CopG/Arc/MetJ family transcriptional regulator
MESEPRGPRIDLPATLLAEVEATADLEHRAASDVVREAVELYLRQSREHGTAVQSGQAPGKLTAAEAVQRILEQRKGNVLPEGVSIRELMTYGRA